MIDFTKQPDRIRQEGYRLAAHQTGIAEGIIEKDFYVVLMLDLLFHHTALFQKVMILSNVFQRTLT